MPDTLRRPWTTPSLLELPKLTALTLASVIGGGGGTGGGGSTVFGLLLAAGLLAGCSADNAMAPDAMPRPGTLVAIPCRADVVARTIACDDGPAFIGGQEILGGQGKRVGLRATGVDYGTIPDKFTFDVTVENYSTQTIGNDGTGPDAVRVYFESEPTVTAGTGTITIENDSIGTVTAGVQHYYKYDGELLPREVSDPATWQFDMPATVLTFSFTVLVAAEVPDQGGLLHWVPFEGLTSGVYTDVASTSPWDVLAVGDGGVSFFWDEIAGTATTLPSASSQDFEAVRPLGGGIYVAADGVGRIWRFDGKLWSVWHEAGIGMVFADIWAYDENWFIAVGDDGAVVYDDGVFSAIEGPPGLIRVSGYDPNNVVAMELLGEFDRRVAAEWLSPVTPAAPGGVVNSALVMLTPTRWVWAVYDGSVDGQILDYNAGVVTSLYSFADSGSSGLAYFGGDSIYAAISSDVGQPSATSTVAAVSLSGLFPPDHLAPPSEGEITQLRGGAFQSLWAANLVQGPLLYSPGGGVVAIHEPYLGDNLSITGAGDSVWVGTSFGALWKIIDGGSPLLIGSVGGPVRGLTYAAPMGRIAAVDGKIFEGATEVYAGGQILEAIWVDAATGAGFAVGGSGAVVRRSPITDTWVSIASGTPVDLHAVWGCSEEEAWMVGDLGNVLHWVNGIFSGEDIPSPSSLRTVTGTSCSDVWIAGNNGEVWHWDGSIWTDHSISPVEDISGLTSRAPGEVYSVSNAQWSWLITTTGAIKHNFEAPGGMSGIWRAGDGKVWALGPTRVLVGQR